MPEPKVEELSVEEIKRQIALVELETAKRTLKVRMAENKEFEEREENNKRVTQIRVDATKREMAENERRRSACAHQTGGKNKEGFLKGDGEQGRAVAPSVLPTGELYFMCIRCQKEWHHPAWIVKIEVHDTGKTTMTKARYEQMAKEYAEVSGWGHKLTEQSEASQFRIPLLDRVNVAEIMASRP
jgi:hypothetical protein